MGRMVVLMAWVMAGRRMGWLEGDAKLVQIVPACGHRSLTVLRKGVVHEVLVAMMALVVAHAMWLNWETMAPRTVVTRMTVVAMMMTTMNLVPR